MSRRFVILAAIAYGIPVLIGCGGGSTGPKTVPVSGTIYLDGEPLADAEVHFFTDEFDAVGVTDADGRYDLYQGAVPGKNKIYIVKAKRDNDPLANFGDPAESGMDETQLQAMAGAAGTGIDGTELSEQVIPAKFSDRQNTVLSYSVPEDGTESADLRIKSE